MLLNNVPKKEAVLCVFIHVLMVVDFILQVIRIRQKKYFTVMIFLIPKVLMDIKIYALL